ncbi:superoxide dismutase [Ascidiimonas aurantiaca]|uniref:superoxide dismutase n=1 Tax=Ascidiimonas aurantiaca TaxID=1685432 RepID=UPI0030EF6230
MDKRKFLKTTALFSSGTAIAPSLILSACKTNEKDAKAPAENSEKAALTTPVFVLPQLPYAYDAFTDTVDAMTMEIHYSKHHQGYVNKLNKAVSEQGITTSSIDDILKKEKLSDGVRNNGGGHYNHSLFWEILTPGGAMSENFEKLLVRDFGSKEAFMNEITQAGLKRFGSGWAWLCEDSDKKLFVTSTPNQDNPLMKVADKQGHPLAGIDVWEHAYYLKYQNKRGEYLNNILNIVNWTKVEERLS